MAENKTAARVVFKPEKILRMPPEIKKRGKIERADSFKIQPYRRLVQWGFLLLVIWIGVEFTIFVNQLQNGQIPTINRPAGVEAFLPLSALISLKYWVLTGILNSIHPASVIILLVILATAVLLKRGFCSWACPIGLLSEYLVKIHKTLFDKPRHLPRFLDYPLRGIKYLLLFYFVHAILIQMPAFVLERFIYSLYNRVADIKMWLFFAQISETTLWVLFILLALSVLIPNFWCRFLCPYGALLGALSWLSPFKISRNTQNCIDCKKCTRACPANIQVHKTRQVFSDECHACMNCIDACPVKDTLHFSVSPKRWKMNRKLYPILIVLIFVAGTGLAKLLGHWDSAISAKEYLYHMEKIHSPEYSH